MVRLGEGHVTFRIRVMPDHVRDLLQDQNRADRCQQPLDHIRREERRDEARAADAHHHLDHTGQHHRQQESLKRAQLGDLRRHDGRQACRRARHARVRSTEDAHQDAAHDPRHDAGEKRRV